MKKTLLLLFMTSCLLQVSIAKKALGRVEDTPTPPKNVPAPSYDGKKGGATVTVTKTPTIPVTKTPEKGNKEMPEKDKPAAKPKPTKSDKKRELLHLQAEFGVFSQGEKRGIV